MNEEIEIAVRQISDALKAHPRQSVTDLFVLLGGRQEILARTLAWLLVRDMIVFRRDKGNLYVTLQSAGKPPEDTPGLEGPRKEVPAAIL